MQSEQQQPEQQQPEQQQPEQQPTEQQRYTYTVSDDGIYTVCTQYGRYELKIIGDPNKLLVIPIKHFYGIDVIVKDGVIQLNQPVQDEPLTATAKTSKPSRSHHVEADNADLRAENERLRAEIEALKNAFNAQHD